MKLLANKKEDKSVAEIEEKISKLHVEDKTKIKEIDQVLSTVALAIANNDVS